MLSSSYFSVLLCHCSGVCGEETKEKEQQQSELFGVSPEFDSFR